MEYFVALVVIGIIAWAVINAVQTSKVESQEARTIKSLPPSVGVGVSRLDNESQIAFFNEYEQKKKKTSVAYLCFIFLGCHYGYVGSWGLQIVFWLTGGGCLVWWLVSLFIMPSIVQKANEQVAREALRDLHLVGYASSN
ncbi:TM2 domain-containing protein [Bifidobacterium crudilactis]|uniref:TM2 domain-containing protein n=1 Tax=Bifidobacterium crudilactis TaxID=327277 RepID=A0A971D092_9BIFI|nr:TM2 domain-containing protein [Bifidobacterium crudilactis]MCI1869029.1 TM2 domain-containing protein [Bifidobacterium crudilactis]NLT80368.1 TM2 domain-containing protein [Bifidobacterium crudilactis]